MKNKVLWRKQVNDIAEVSVIYYMNLCDSAVSLDIFHLENT